MITNRTIYNQVTLIGITLAVLITLCCALTMIDAQDNKSIDVHKYNVYYEYDIIMGDTVLCDIIRETIY